MVAGRFGSWGIRAWRHQQRTAKGATGKRLFIGRARRKKNITDEADFTSFIIIDAKYCDCPTIDSAPFFA
jgi:hypothetical protein